MDPDPLAFWQATTRAKRAIFPKTSTIEFLDSTGCVKSCVPGLKEAAEIPISIASLRASEGLKPTRKEPLIQRSIEWRPAHPRRRRRLPPKALQPRSQDRARVGRRQPSLRAMLGERRLRWRRGVSDRPSL